MQKKILFLTRLFNPHIGGVEKHVDALSSELSNRGYEITIITEQLEPNLKIKQNLSKYQIFHIPIIFKSSKLRIWYWIIQHRKLFIEADIVHVHDVGWWIYPLLPFIRRKFYITFHGWEGKYPPEKKVIFQRRILASLAKGVVQVGDFIEKWYGTKADVVTYGATDDFNPKISGSNDRLVFLGRLTQENCIEQVLLTFQYIRKLQPNIKFTFVGDGMFRKNCEEFGQVTGFVKNTVKHLAEAKIVFANSYLSILESQANSKLVCAMYAHDLKHDYLQLHPNAKTMLIEKDSQIIAQRVIGLLEHKTKLNQYIKQGYGWATQQTWQKLADQYEQLWGRK